MLISYFWGWAGSVRFVRQKSGQRWGELPTGGLLASGCTPALMSIIRMILWRVVMAGMFLILCLLIFVSYLFLVSRVFCLAIVNIWDSVSFIWSPTFPFSFTLFIVYFHFHFLLFIITFTFIWLKSILRTAFPLFDDLLSLSLSSYLIIYFLFHVHSKYLWQFFLYWIIYFPFQIISLSTFTFLITVSDCLLSLFLSHSHLYNI